MIDTILLIIIAILVAKIAFIRSKSTDASKILDLTNQLKNSETNLRQAVDASSPVVGNDVKLKIKP